MKKSTYVIFGILIGLTLVKLYKINGGFVLGEPDERNYVDVVRNFQTSLLPNYDGIPLFHSPPFFHYVSFLFSFIFEVKYLALRMVSLISSLILSLLIYQYLKEKLNEAPTSLRSRYILPMLRQERSPSEAETSLHSPSDLRPWFSAKGDKRLAVFGAILFSILPLTIYFARLGLIEMLLTTLAFLFIFSFDLGFQEGKRRWAFLSGLGLGFGLITKYSILPITFVPLTVFGVWVMSKLWQTKKITFVFEKEFIAKVQYIFIIYFVALTIFLPVTYFNYQLAPFEFKTQFKQDFALAARKIEIPVILNYMTAQVDYLGWGGAVLLVLGLISLMKKAKNFLVILLTIVLLNYALVRVALYEPRYFMIQIPFLVVLMILGFDLIWNMVTKLTSIQTKKYYFQAGLFILFLLSILPTSLEALESGYHTIIEDAAQYVKGQNTDNSWVVSNYWPSAFVDDVGYKITWYSSDLRDSAAASGGGKTKYMQITKPAFDIINQEGGWVIIEELYSPVFSFGRERKPIAESITKSQTPVKVFTDTQSNWPFFSEKTNRISIFHVPKPN